MNFLKDFGIGFGIFVVGAWLLTFALTGLVSFIAWDIEPVTFAFNWTVIRACMGFAAFMGFMFAMDQAGGRR